VIWIVSNNQQFASRVYGYLGSWYLFIPNRELTVVMVLIHCRFVARHRLVKHTLTQLTHCSFKAFMIVAVELLLFIARQLDLFDV